MNAFCGRPAPPNGEPSRDPLRTTLQDIVFTMNIPRILGGLIAELHVLRVVEKFERRKAAHRADADAVLHPLNSGFFYRCMKAVKGLNPKPCAQGNTETKDAYPFLLETEAIFRRACEEEGVSFLHLDLEYLDRFMHEAASDLETATKT
ncbi:hypothetical protein F751_1908 [Auxenochlorella protothecoides]|uniref:Uncharacterized protein n=1 Tax=Auxenochlorella protothecoides TaxID=3075 RepID=A0A087SH25_AUXPR|nr:hypothetical protein F751_1908 [Auxenochlorella protothecoides]KFM25029.1 hypothetical protein F751_1908 [Auxenochlorella protothecoides]